jgi:transposase-like protein
MAKQNDTADLLNPIFMDEDSARVHLENLRWAAGRVCPHCGVVDGSGEVASKNHKPGLYHCNSCKTTFTVTVGTLFERSHIPLNKWLLAFHLMAASKKGMSAKQMERMLGLSYKSAWFMCHRIREAMKCEPSKMLGGPGSSGIVEADETYWGAAADAEGIKYPKGIAPKMKIVSLVERDGEKRSFHVANVNAATLGPILKAQISAQARLMTDEAAFYKKPGKHFASHQSVNHSKAEYARGDVTSNTVESSFAILKRGLTGTFHSVSEKHLQRYCNEFDFRWNMRQSQGFSDAMRADMALKGITGKRLTYRRINPPITAFQ